MPHYSSTILIVGHGILYIDKILSYHGEYNIIFLVQCGKAWKVTDHNKLLLKLISTEEILSVLRELEDSGSLTDVVNVKHRPKDLDISDRALRTTLENMPQLSLAEFIQKINLQALEGNRAWELYNHKITSAEDLLCGTNPPLFPSNYDNNYLEHTVFTNAMLDGNVIGLKWQIYINLEKLKKLLENVNDEAILSEQFYYMTPYFSQDRNDSMYILDVLDMIPKIHILCDRSAANLVKLVYLEDAQDHPTIVELIQTCINMHDITIPRDANIIWGTCRGETSIIDRLLHNSFTEIDNHANMIEPYMYEGYFGGYYYM